MFQKLTLKGRMYIGNQNRAHELPLCMYVHNIQNLNEYQKQKEGSFRRNVISA